MKINFSFLTVVWCKEREWGVATRLTCFGAVLLHKRKAVLALNVIEK